MRDLYPRPPPDLRRRIGIAAAAEDIPTTRLCRRAIDRWLVLAIRDVGPPVEEGPWQRISVPVSDGAHRAIRVLAAELDLSVSDIATRILNSQVPYAVESLVRAMEEGA